MLAFLAAVAMSQPAYPMTIMTYNVRYGSAQDGADSWPNRRTALLDRIRVHAPDVLGVQEALDFQVQEIAKALPDHRMVGVGRDDGKSKGEYSAIFFRKSGFAARAEGTRWISDRPEQPGSIGPGAHLPRVFTWVSLAPVSGKSLLVVNTHFDHESPAARTLGSSQIADFVNAYPKPFHVVVMGDFNTGPKDVPPMYLSQAADLTALKPTQGPIGTFNGFKLDQTGGEMIDHIFISKGITAKAVVIDRTTYEVDRTKRYPSDHFPIVAHLEMP